MGESWGEDDRRRSTEEARVSLKKGLNGLSSEYHQVRSQRTDLTFGGLED
jgi:hypothetical protein